MKRIKNSFPCGTQTHGQGQGKGSFPHCAHLAAWGLQVSLLGIQSTLGWLQGLVSSFFSTWSSASSRSVWNLSHFTLRSLTAFVQGQKVAVSIQVHYWPLYNGPGVCSPPNVPLANAAVLWKSDQSMVRHCPLSIYVARFLVFPREFWSCFCVAEFCHSSSGWMYFECLDRHGCYGHFAKQILPIPEHRIALHLLLLV